MTTLTKRRGAPDTEDATPARRGSATGSKASGGWGSYAAKRRTNTAFTDEFRPVDGVEVLIKFLDEAPYDVYLQHWIDEAPKRKSFVCLEEDCPLCEIGDKPSTFSLFNVLNITAKGAEKSEPVVQPWKTSVTVSDVLSRLAQAKRSQPLNREDLYFVVLMTKASKRTSYDIQPLKARDLEEDGWKVEPFSAKELGVWGEDRFEDISVVTKVDTREELQELADSLDR